jgi:hypothetical protein
MMLRYCGNVLKNGRKLSVLPVVGEPSGAALVSVRHTRSLPREPTYDTVTELLRNSSRWNVAWK